MAQSRAKKRAVLFKKLALQREQLRPTLGADGCSDHDYFLKFVERAEAVESQLFKFYSKKPALLTKKFRNLTYGLGQNPKLIENVLTKVGGWVDGRIIMHSSAARVCIYRLWYIVVRVMRCALVAVVGDVIYERAFLPAWLLLSWCVCCLLYTSPSPRDRG